MSPIMSGRLAAALCLVGLLVAALNFSRVEGGRGGQQAQGKQNKPFKYMDENYQIPAVDPILAQENLRLSSRFGLPSSDNLRLFNSYILSYDRRLKNPAWVFELLNANNFKGSSKREGLYFKEDLALHEYFRSNNYDFMRSGYARGHLASSGDYVMDRNSMAQTYTLSNIVPQNQNMNSGGWVRLEYYVRSLAKRPEVGQVYAVTGPVYLPVEGQDHKMHVSYKVIGRNQVAVPTHLFKVFLVETKSGQLSLEAFLMPNTDEANSDIKTINKYRVPIENLDSIERSTGFVFFPKLNRKQAAWPTELQYNFVDARITFER